MQQGTELLTYPNSTRRPRATVEIVVPVYNEEHELEASIRRLHGYLSTRFPLSWVVTIADNASTDRTWGIACRLASELDGVRASHLEQKGRGRALRAARQARPDRDVGVPRHERRDERQQRAQVGREVDVHVGDDVGLAA